MKKAQPLCVGPDISMGLERTGARIFYDEACNTDIGKKQRV